MNKSPSASQSTPSDAIQSLSTQMLSMDVAQWKVLVARINEPTTARIIVEYLDSNSVQKNRYAGIYLRARYRSTVSGALRESLHMGSAIRPLRCLDLPIQAKSNGGQPDPCPGQRPQGNAGPAIGLA